MPVSSIPVKILRNSCLVGVASVILPSLLSGQEGRQFSAAVLVGPTSYDLSGTGTGVVLAGELDYVPLTPLVLEVGVTYFGYTAQFGDEVRFLFPELSMQGQIPIGRVRPYLGGGIGRSIVVSGRTDNELTLHAVGGLRILLDADWGVRGELRVRAINPFAGSMGDFAFGVTKAL